MKGILIKIFVVVIQFILAFFLSLVLVDTHTHHIMESPVRIQSGLVTGIDNVIIIFNYFLIAVTILWFLIVKKKNLVFVIVVILLMIIPAIGNNILYSYVEKDAAKILNGIKVNINNSEILRGPSVEDNKLKMTLNIVNNTNSALYINSISLEPGVVGCLVSPEFLYISKQKAQKIDIMFEECDVHCSFADEKGIIMPFQTLLLGSFKNINFPYTSIKGDPGYEKKYFLGVPLEPVLRKITARCG